MDKKNRLLLGLFFLKKQSQFNKKKIKETKKVTKIKRAIVDVNGDRHVNEAFFVFRHLEMGYK